MKKILKITFLLFVSAVLNSCSLFLGGIVALDNSAYEGEREIEYESIIKLEKDKKIILELTDSTKISGLYQGFQKLNKKGKEINRILILNENDELKFVNTSEISKYIYRDEGGNVWTAIAIGGVVDALIIYGALTSHGPGLGGSSRLF